MKKLLSLVLVVVFISSMLCINVNADDSLVYKGSARIVIEETNTFDPENFNIVLSVNQNSIGAFDGQNNDVKCNIDSIKSEYIDYATDPDAFNAVFTAEDFVGAPIDVDFSFEFLSEGVFGELEYTITISGFSAPIDTGDLGGLLGDSAGDIALNIPTDIVHTGTIESFPTVDFSTINVLSIPQKTVYYDSEKFDATGTKLEFSLTNGKTGVFTYNEENAHLFTFVPTNSEQLSVHDTEVATILCGGIICYTPITVKHKWSDGYVNITTDKYAENKPGYHAIVCEGCGETHDAQPHTPKNEEWTYNNDQTFVANGTESNVCVDCGTVLIRDTFGTADFNTAFADMHFIKVIFEYINVLLRFIGAATY